MENNKNKKSVKFQGDMLNYCDFIQVFVFTSYHHLNVVYPQFSKIGAPKLITVKFLKMTHCCIAIQ